jgi:hypothetical protein
MRHSDINLTMSRYSHVLRGQESEAIARLPDLSLPSRHSQGAKATGTEGSGEWAPKWTPLLTPTAFSECNQSSAVGNEQKDYQENVDGSNCLNRGGVKHRKSPLGST